VDHKIPRELFALGLADGDPDSDENLQGMCKPCHSAKTAAEDGGFGNERRVP
jgi:5-methylcytosine-specific restriction endonuclease McrA